MLIFEKKLSQSERERHWIKVPSESFGDLPLQGEVFCLSVKSRKVNVKIDKNGRLLGLGREVFRDLSLEGFGSIAVVEKTANGIYTLERKTEIRT